MANNLPERRQYDSWRWRLLSIWIIIFSVVVIYAIAQIRNQQRSIQNQRRDAIRRTCEDQNARHDNTISELDTILSAASVGASKERVAQLHASRASTILLINALAPKQDCSAVVARSVKGI